MEYDIWRVGARGTDLPGIVMVEGWLEGGKGVSGSMVGGVQTVQTGDAGLASGDVREAANLVLETQTKMFGFRVRNNGLPSLE